MEGRGMHMKQHLRRMPMPHTARSGQRSRHTYHALEQRPRHTPCPGHTPCPPPAGAPTAEDPGTCLGHTLGHTLGHLPWGTCPGLPMELAGELAYHRWCIRCCQASAGACHRHTATHTLPHTLCHTHCHTLGHATDTQILGHGTCCGAPLCGGGGPTAGPCGEPGTMGWRG